MLQFGNPIGTQTTPGLKFKLPGRMWNTMIAAFCRSIRPPGGHSERSKADQRGQLRPIQDRRCFGVSEKRQQSRNFAAVFGNQLNAAVRTEIGRIELDDVLTEKRAESMVRITERMKVAGARYGVEVVDVRIGRTTCRRKPRSRSITGCDPTAWPRPPNFAP